jgi:dnd system-associated protein 4
MRRRVRRPADKDQLLKTLTENQRPFATMAHALVFASSLGYAEGRRISFDKSSEQIPWEVFANTGAEQFIDMLAGVVADETDILADERVNDRLDIFEEFANGGLELIAERLTSDHRPPLESLLDLMLKYEASRESKPDIDLAAIAADLTS